MIRSIAIAIIFACIAAISSWFIIPAATYIETALGIMIIVFLVSGVSALIAHRIYLSIKQ